MRISELSATSGVPIASIKFYLREHLLPAGEAIGATQASYGDEHLHRLRLIKALIDRGGLSVAGARSVLEALDEPGVSINHVFGAAQAAASAPSKPCVDVAPSRLPGLGAHRVDAAVSAMRWNAAYASAWKAEAAAVLDSFAATGHPELIGVLDEYCRAAEVVARADLTAVLTQPGVGAMAESIVAGMVLGDSLFAALRRVAQEHVTGQIFPSTDTDTGTDIPLTVIERITP